MNEQQKDFIKLLFPNVSDRDICLSSDCLDTVGVSLKTALSGDIEPKNFFIVNPIKTGRSRTDDNVAEFRNILLEFDSVPLEKQLDLVSEAALPVTTQVYSGGKSFHFIVSLETPMPDIEAYRQLANWLYVIFDGAVDPKCKNPARFSRFPEVFRKDKNRPQTLKWLGNRVSDEELNEFLDLHWEKIEAYEQALREEEEAAHKASEALRAKFGDDYRGMLSIRTRKFLGRRQPDRGRHNELYYCASDFKNQNYELEEAIEQLIPVASYFGLTVSDATRTIKNAYKKAQIRPRAPKGINTQ